MANTRLASLEPEFRPIVEAVLKDVSEVTGLPWIIVSGRRSMLEQGQLFDQGRILPGKIVTKARPGESAHNFGLAADLAPMKDGKVWWNAPREIWQAMADIAVAKGLTAGFYFKSFYDAPHIESPSWKIAQSRWKAGELQVA